MDIGRIVGFSRGLQTGKLTCAIPISHFYGNAPLRDSALKWKNVDLVKCVIHVEETFSRTKSNGLVAEEIKTTHSELDVYLLAVYAIY
jgi:hypothetical protein